MADIEDDDAAGKKTNIILTYKELSGIHLELQKVGASVERLDEKLDAVGKQHIDHEIRIRALELSGAQRTGGSGMAQWATPIILTVVSILFALLNYLKP